jgi:hypothetical protein
MSGLTTLMVSYRDERIAALGRDSLFTLHQDQRQLWGNARVSNRLKSDTVAVYFER